MKKFMIGIILVFTLVAIAVSGYMVFCPNKPEISNYRIETEEKDEGLWCVKVSGMKNRLTQAKLNRTIREEWIFWLQDYLESPAELSPDLSGYLISDQYLCITGSFDSYGTRGGGKKYYCAVYDLKTGDKVYLDDLFEFSDGFVQALQQYGKTWQCDLGEVVVRIPGFENDSAEEIRDYLEKVIMTQADYNDMISGTDRKSYFKPDFIVAEDYLYLTVKIPLDKLEEFLKVPKWWKSKPGLENADLERVNSEIKKYLGMTNREISDLTEKKIENYADTFVFKTKALLPCIRPENLPFYFVCSDWWYDEPPGYLAFYEEAEKEYMELLGINKDMGFRNIIETMGADSAAWESTEGVDELERERHKIEFEKYGLRYVFCSDDAEGYNFSMFIARTNQKKDVYRSDEKNISAAETYAYGVEEMVFSFSVSEDKTYHIPYVRISGCPNEQLQWKI